MLLFQDAGHRSAVRGVQHRLAAAPRTPAAGRPAPLNTRFPIEQRLMQRSVVTPVWRHRLSHGVEGRTTTEAFKKRTCLESELWVEIGRYMRC